MKITVVGLGKIGLPLAVQFASTGHEVIGADVNAATVATLEEDRDLLPSQAHLTQTLASVWAKGRLTATTSTSLAMCKSDVVVVVLPVFVSIDGTPDFDWLDAVTRDFAAELQPDTLVALIEAGIDSCLVAVPTVFQESVGLALTDGGVHSMIEKPLAQDTPLAERLAATFADLGLIGMGHIERYNPVLQSARPRVRAVHLGRVYEVVTRRQGPFTARIPEVDVLKDLSTNDINVTAWVTPHGHTRIIAAPAHFSGCEFEELPATTGLLANGTVDNHLFHWLSPLKERVTGITGEKGAFGADNLAPDLTFYANGLVHVIRDGLTQFRGASDGDIVSHAISKPKPLRVEHEQFHDPVPGKSADIVKMLHGLSTVPVAQGCSEPGKSGLIMGLAA